MKRISLMLALFLTLSFGMALAQNPDGSYINLNSVDGLIAGKIPCNLPGSEVKFHFDYYNGNAAKAKGITNGYELHATGGATWTGGHFDEFTFDPGFNFDLVWKHVEFSWDGADYDTIGFGGSTGADDEDGLPPGYNGPGVAISVTFDVNAAWDGETFCIDSCFYPTSGTWMWAYGSAIGSFPPDWDGPHCYELYEVPDLPPVWDIEHLSYSGDHCDLVVLNYEAHDVDATAGGITFSLVSGSGAVTTTSVITCQLTYAPVLADVGGGASATLGVADAVNPVVTTVTNMNFTNEDPTFVGGLNTLTYIGMGNTGCAPLVTTDDEDCDPSSVSILSVTPTPFNGMGAVSIVDLGGNTYQVCFATAAGVYPGVGDGGQVFDVVLKVDDFGPVVRASNTGTVQFEVLTVEPYEVQIEKTHNTLQGMHVIVDVTLNAGSEDLGGYDFMIAYDASALNFIAAIPGDFHTMCGWEYFNYRFGPTGNCGNACPSGMLEVIAIAETNNGANHPTCFTLAPPAVLFSLDFLVSDDRTLECMYVPIRFFWTNCTDNSIAYHPGDDPLASIQGVSRFVIDFDLIGHIEDMFTGFPTYTGVQYECLVQDDPTKPVPMQFVDFLNGGVDIVCADSIDARGDLNLNGNANEIADAVLFSNYFVKGIGVFNVNYQGQVAASDVNADGLTLSVADLVYLIRVIVGDALPYPKLGAEAASYAYENGVMSVDSKMGAAFVVIEGNVNPTLLADKMEMNYAFDGNNTRVLVSNIERGADFEGSFLQFDGRVVSAEFATYDGAPVAQKLVPTSFSLAQNYPNPFNGMTKIAFGMPTAGDYTLTIYNVTGQKVADFAGSSEAGMVTIDWDAVDQASGVYFYKLDTDNFTDTKKMVYLK